MPAFDRRRRNRLLATLLTLVVLMPAVPRTALAVSADCLSRIAEDADLRNCDFAGADLSGASMWNANLTGANFAGADLSSAQLYQANLTNANFTGADLTFAALSDATVKGAAFKNATLTGLEAIGTIGKPASLPAGCRIAKGSFAGKGARLQWADLSGTNLAGLNLTGADLRETMVRATDLRNANLTDVDFSKADLSNARFEGANLMYARFSQTICPDGVTSGMAGGTCVYNLTLVSITLNCRGTPEKTTIANRTRWHVVVQSIKTLYAPLPAEPFTPNRTIAAGESVTFQSGPGAGTPRLTSREIYTNARRDGVRVTTNIGTFTKRCG